MKCKNFLCINYDKHDRRLSGNCWNDDRFVEICTLRKVFNRLLKAPEVKKALDSEREVTDEKDK